MSDTNIRGLIVDSLLTMEKEGTYLSVLENTVLDKYDYLSPRDKAFYKRVLSGCIERKIRIDHVLGLFSNTPVRKMKPAVRAILRSSVYQILWMDSVPDSAVCNEAVKLVVSRGLAGLKGFVNGVLRNICRNRDNIKYPDREEDPVKYMSVMYSCPEWIVVKLLDEIGEELTEGFLKSSMEAHPICVRMRTGADETEKLINAWKSRGITVSKNPMAENAYLLDGCDGVSNLPGYDEGAFAVQDTGSMLVAALAGIKAHDTVMDVCAAPGGKSMHAADILRSADPEDPGMVYSYDISEEKCERIRENADRLGVTNIRVSSHDATVFIPEMEETADVVMVDAPCSGIGVIGHKSDIKYRLKSEDIDTLAGIQRRIVDTAVRYVRPGGRLVYSTCTVSRQENTQVKEYILDKYSFKLVNITENGDMQLIPGRDASDGFYIAVFERV